MLKIGTPSWTLILAWIIKGRLPRLGSQAWVIKGDIFLDPDFGMGYKGGRLPGPGFRLRYKDKSGRIIQISGQPSGQIGEQVLTGYPMIYPVNPMNHPDQSESGQISDG
ncbi:hypothetical protein GLOIN_2v1773859 [Rhizophagus irregularis DAOM 181602=DAOM 197198]|uniref:Uncharacterized protein n=1 Tax=Rhizophagus irregularis (strain DAOM 181602 / DAOM 197198 / MUCL 43194) TaxID=747089 RepID=A0A2P4Q3U9_RHIID|nr:hypothetical protein GLOIN_2v1773859 [Rhizophagus irregularis DAOM 181602=DAOM 197198]POG72331.1 hypothetical protein GLOIN_2v1773859 [Rhizophagus irregularis DAOM 181602=DAOM 197198]|eukprot:XP_025179197.1 hypothetical protein GLOIN_2v1773859 [Rhizophagus irregularis DAOM 181602=DAOM 197198]